MNQFINEYIARLQTVNSYADVERLYHWLWDNQNDIAQTAREINRLLSLSDPVDLQPDLPCMTIEPRAALLFLLVNPSWRPAPSVSTKEDAHCRTSKEDYVDYMFNYLERAPVVLGQYLRYTCDMISFIPILRNGAMRVGKHRLEARWQAAHDNSLVGHWQLFPFRSAKDGITRYMKRQPWLADCFRQSAKAALRLQPELLLVFSRQGYELLRNHILPPTQPWTETRVGRKSTPIHYATCHGGERATEVVAIGRQVISCREKVFKHQEFFAAVDALRAHYPSNPP